MGDTGYPCTLELVRSPTREERLWAGVIRQALMDARSPILGERRAAKSWLRSQKFRDVADLAGLDPDHVQRLALAVIGQKDKADRRGDGGGPTITAPSNS